MHIHILGMGGTLMAGIALLAKEQGHAVTGYDTGLYPPMSDVLAKAGLSASDETDIDALPDSIDLWVIGNGMRRGHPLVESILRRQLPYQSGPEFLAQHVLPGHHVIAVAGTHGKTSTTALLVHLLHQVGISPGYLVAGLPVGAAAPAALGTDPYFVIEADEYDTAFFDKRPKCLHYRPQTLILNNLEFDHADIFDDLAQIKTQFQLLLRTVPDNGCVVYHQTDINLLDVIAKGCWTPTCSFGQQPGATYELLSLGEQGSAVSFWYAGKAYGFTWQCMGLHHANNALAAIGAAKAIGVSVADSVQALSSFAGVKRRMERIARSDRHTLYDDFAHHPTAIAANIASLRQRAPGQTLTVVLVLASYTMRSGVHEAALEAMLQGVDQAIIFIPPGSKPLAESVVAWANASAQVTAISSVEGVCAQIVKASALANQIVIMSNQAVADLSEGLCVALDLARCQSKTVG